MLAALLVTLGLAAQVAVPSREERVLALLGGVARAGSYYYADTIFQPSEPPLDSGPVFVPRVALFLCGTRSHYALDVERARALARALFSCYGVELEVDHPEAEGVHAVVLDGLDLTTGLGFELRGRLQPPTDDELAGRSYWSDDVEPEDPAVALDADELAWLRARGLRLHVADVVAYAGSLERCTPLLAYLASVVRFLNEATPGEDVELGGVLFEREAVWTLPLASRDGVRVETDAYGTSLYVERATTLTLPCRGQADFEAAPERDSWGLYETADETLKRRGFDATRGVPSVLYWQGGALATAAGVRPDYCLRFRQRLDDSTLERESPSNCLFLPSAAELTQPFELELELAPGRYVLGPIHLGTAARGP